MTELVLAVVVFVTSHAVPALAPLRAALVARLGRRGYLGLYSVASIGALVWLGSAYARAPYVELWPFQPWTLWLPPLAMPVACVLVVAGLTAPNPLSMTAAKAPFDPGRPGLVALTRHPVPWGFALWAGAHLAPNGDVASAILFGLLLALGLGGTASLDHKRRVALGDAEWRRLAARTSNLPFAALVTGRAPFRFAGTAVAPIAGGVALYLVLLALHLPVIGVSPVPY